MKPKVQVTICIVFGAAISSVGFAIHGILSLFYLILGNSFTSYGLYVALQNLKTHGVAKKTSKNWSILLFCILATGAGIYWKEHNQSVANQISAPLDPDSKRKEIRLFMGNTGPTF